MELMRSGGSRLGGITQQDLAGLDAVFLKCQPGQLDILGIVFETRDDPVSSDGKALHYRGEAGVYAHLEHPLCPDESGEPRVALGLKDGRHAPSGRETLIR